MNENFENSMNSNISMDANNFYESSDFIYNSSDESDDSDDYCCSDDEQSDCQDDSDSNREKNESSEESYIVKILINFSKECNPPHQHVDYLLKQFKPYAKNLPCSHKTLLKNENSH